MHICQVDMSNLWWFSTESTKLGLHFPEFLSLPISEFGWQLRNWLGIWKAEVKWSAALSTLRRLA